MAAVEVKIVEKAPEDLGWTRRTDLEEKHDLKYIYQKGETYHVFQRGVVLVLEEVRQ